MSYYSPFDETAEELCAQAAASAQAGNVDEAAAQIERILEQFPGYPRAVHAKGFILGKAGKTADAITIIQECVDKNPCYIEALNSLGMLYRDQRDYEKSLECFEKIFDLDRNNVQALYNIGSVCQKDRNKDKALEYFKRVIDINPTHLPALIGITQLLIGKNLYSEAEAYCRQVLDFDETNEDAILHMGSIRSEQGNLEEALRFHNKLKLSAKHALTSRASVIYHLNMIPGVTQKEIFHESRLFEKKCAAHLHVHQRPHLNSPIPERKIRIGFMSGDFKLHPVARHLLPLIRHLDRDHFELYAYSNYNVHDSITELMKSLFCFWRNIHDLSDDIVTDMVRLDNIDILIDLAGYTGFSRLMLFARKPAPVQVTWLGYFNTTGFKTVDYLISDAITIRKGEEKWFSEKILRMPHSRFCYEPIPNLPDIASLPQTKNGFITFGSFNKVKKVNEEVLDSWAEILAALPGSCLILKWKSFKEQVVKDWILGRFVSSGISADRIIFRDESGYRDLLREYTDDIDIALDTFPHAGGSTSCDAFLMGVPVVTLSGNLAISRQTHGYISVMGLEDQLVAFSRDEYIAKAIALASDVSLLAGIRSSLREKFVGSPLCDGAAFAEDFGKLMRHAWSAWCKTRTIETVLSHTNPNENEVYNEGINLMNNRMFAASSTYFSKVVAINPKNDKARNNLAICLMELGRMDEADSVLRAARRINPLNDDVCCNLAHVLLQKRNYKTAERYCDLGLLIRPESQELIINKALAQQGNANLAAARETLLANIDQLSETNKIMSMLGNIALEMGDVSCAEDYFKKARDADGGYLEAHQSNLLFNMNNHPKYNQQQIYDEAMEWERRYATDTVDVFQGKRTKNAILRVGFVSADFRRHPGGALSRLFFENYDRNTLSVYCYFNNTRHDELTEIIKTNATSWHEVRYLSDEELFAQIQRDNIDILVDMSGHTDGNRLKLFSMRPCPIQATWLGYFNTTGVRAIDYFISDEFTTPHWMQEFFSEKIVCLPHSRFCFSMPDYSPLISFSPVELKGYVTFGAFNNCAKISDVTISIWSRILKAVPRSRLLLKWKSYKDKEVRATFLERFTREGIRPDRISFRGYSLHAQMLADYSNVDIVLDTYPFNGGMTSLEALWMGVPIITLAGMTPASRQTGSFLRLLGLENLVSYDQDAYIQTAVELARDRSRLYDIRSSLRQTMKHSPLMDGKKFAMDMQELLEKMYRTHGGRYE